MIETIFIPAPTRPWCEYCGHTIDGSYYVIVRSDNEDLPANGHIHPTCYESILGGEPT